MPVLRKTKHKDLLIQLSERYNRLRDVLQARPLRSSSEGLKGRFNYADPDSMCGTIGDLMELRMAVSDFKTILNEISSLK